MTGFQIGIAYIKLTSEKDMIETLSSIITPSSEMILAVLVELDINDDDSLFGSVVETLQRKRIPDTLGPNIDLIVGIRILRKEDLHMFSDSPIEHFFVDVQELDNDSLDNILSCHCKGTISIITDYVSDKISIEKLHRISLILTESMETTISLLERGYFGAMPFMNTLLRKGSNVSPNMPERSVMADLDLLETINVYTLQKNELVVKNTTSLKQISKKVPNEINSMSFTDIMKQMLKGPLGSASSLERVTFRSPILDAYLVSLSLFH